MTRPDPSLLDLLAGELPEDEAARREARLGAAERAELEGLRRAVGWLQRAAPEVDPPPALRSRILGALEEEIQAATPWHQTLRAWMRLAMAGALALTLLGAFVGYGGYGLSPAPPRARSLATQVRVAAVLASADVARPGETLEAGRELVLGVGGEIRLDWRGHGPLSFRGPGRLVIRDWAVELTGGAVLSEIDPPDRHGFQVRTPDAVVSVVGTRFEVVHELEKGSRVEVFEGRVQVEHRLTGVVRFLSPTGDDGARWKLWEAKLDGAEPPVRDIRLVEDGAAPLPMAGVPADLGGDGGVPPPPAPPDPALALPASDPAPPATDPSDGEAGAAGTDGDEPPPDPSELPAETVEQGF